MKHYVVDAILQFHEVNPFLRGIRSWVSFKQIGVEYQRNARAKGKSGYTFKKYFSLADAAIPLRLATIFGLLAAFAGFVFATWVVCLWLIKPFDVSDYTSLVVIITFLGGA